MTVRGTGVYILPSSSNGNRDRREGDRGHYRKRPVALDLGTSDWQDDGVTRTLVSVLRSSHDRGCRFPAEGQA